MEAIAENDAANPIYAGALVSALVKTEAGVPVLKLPSSARRPGSQDEVLVVKNGVLEPRRVQFTLDPAGNLLVRSGISADEDILFQPSAEARAGDSVQVPKVAP